MIRTLHHPEPQRLIGDILAPSIAPARAAVQLTFAEIENESRLREQAAAKADPKANRTTRVFDSGVDASYRFFAVRAKGVPEVRFCWTVNRNAAGRFLIFKEAVTKSGIKRTRFEAILDKRAAMAACRLYRDELIQKRKKQDRPCSGGGSNV